MSKQPYIPLYTGDYLQDTRMLPLSVRGAWIEIMIHMWRSKERGVIIGTIPEFAMMMGCGFDEANNALTILRQKEVCDFEVLPNGMFKLISRRMVRDAKTSIERAKSGATGGKSARKTFSKDLYNLPGFIYIMKDIDRQGDYKIGISKDPKKRVYGVRRDTGRENLLVIWTLEVPDMGAIESFVVLELSEFLDGEWGKFKSDEHVIELVSKSTSKFKAKQKQNTDNDNAIENGIELKLKESLDEIYIDGQRPKWSHIEFDEELKAFIEKVRGSPGEYADRSTDKIRLAFQYQLRHAKKKQPNGTGFKATSGKIEPHTGKRYDEGGF